MWACGSRQAFFGSGQRLCCDRWRCQTVACGVTQALNLRLHFILMIDDEQAAVVLWWAVGLRWRLSGGTFGCRRSSSSWHGTTGGRSALQCRAASERRRPERGCRVRALHVQPAARLHQAAADRSAQLTSAHNHLLRAASRLLCGGQRRLFTGTLQPRLDLGHHNLPQAPAHALCTFAYCHLAEGSSQKHTTIYFTHPSSPPSSTSSTCRNSSATTMCVSLEVCRWLRRGSFSFSHSMAA